MDSASSKSNQSQTITIYRLETWSSQAQNKDYNLLAFGMIEQKSPLALKKRADGKDVQYLSNYVVDLLGYLA